MATYVLKRYEPGVKRFIKIGWIFDHSVEEIHEATLFKSKNEVLRAKYKLSDPDNVTVHRLKEDTSCG